MQQILSGTNPSVDQAQPATKTRDVISVQGLNKRVSLQSGELSILNDIHLEVRQGESLAIVGRSGSGKTTLLGLLAGLDVASSGSVRLLGQALETLSEDERAALRARQVGFVFQSFHLLPAMTALENVMLPLELTGEQEAEKLARDYLCELGLQDRLQSFPSQLSGGEQQRVAIARA
ncbi:MAG: ATP-binding cassette domain-containing protein, partial [Oleiphilaceae bacterium]|nr:ATP-binding cassette domain-containing protein [Oleiphilaceae bacterium]